MVRRVVEVLYQTSPYAGRVSGDVGFPHDIVVSLDRVFLYHIRLPFLPTGH
jgi:hypothetical protein